MSRTTKKRMRLVDSCKGCKALAIQLGELSNDIETIKSWQRSEINRLNLVVEKLDRVDITMKGGRVR